MEEILPLIDFSKVKKKKRKPQSKKEEDEDLEGIVLTKKKGGKKKNKKEEKQENTINTSEGQNTESTSDIYGVNLSYDYLLTRIYSFIREKNPNSSSSGIGIKIPAPQVNLVGKSRSCWTNFEDFVKAINRPINHISQYVLGELGAEGTIGGDNQLNLKIKVTQSTLQKILSKYINDYVRCQNCKSVITIFKKRSIYKITTNLL